MKTRNLIILGSIISLTVIGTVIINLTYGQYMWKEQVDGLEQIDMINDIPLSISSAKEFLKMDCEDLNHIYPEFPNKEVADAWNARMHECINAQESTSAPMSDLTSNLDETGNLSGYDSVTELATLQKMSCDEIISRNQLGGDYLTKENRSYVKDRLQECDEEMKATEEYAQFRELRCDELVAFDGKLDVINSQQVRDYIAREIIDCKNRNYYVGN
ncbi:hypothetical protein [Nitrosopumilus ureiphilus]|uniref:Uncharacterized protein n=1 Tax=Nitrosopumilus ureiphilus TaxID=1470067 RepID=A0A7D5RDS3_9ARCH|nr:hypothetical protein [Nitrosopumilus ureiphilus]QLH06523.1 hypothetical protein C5F50_05125 [Nitrosopumilus ureiphilus]